MDEEYEYRLICDGDHTYDTYNSKEEAIKDLPTFNLMKVALDGCEDNKHTIDEEEIGSYQYQKLQEENEKLKKDIKDIQEIWVKSRDYGNQMFVENEKLKKEIVEYESVEQSLMKCVREGGGYDEMLPIHYRQESESDDE